MTADTTTGTLYGVGLGPGDPELLTRKAARVLSEVPVIFTPTAKQEKDSYALAIIESLDRRPDQVIVTQVFPMTKDKDELNRFWERACNQIIDELRQGKDCAFITEGDPMIYSTFSYVLEYFESFHPEIDIEVIPGISSLNATAARARVPLCKAGQKLAICPVGYDDDAMGQIIDDFDAVALLKTYRAKDTVLDLFKSRGLESSVVFAEKVTGPGERIVRDIRQLQNVDIGYFSLLVMHKDLNLVQRPA